MKALLALFAALLVVDGCSSPRIRSFQAIDPAQRTITVPPGGGLTGAIKDALASDGGKITVYRGSEIRQGTMGETTRLERSRKFETHYAMFLRWQQFDVCVFGFDPAYHYDISVVDTESGSGVLTLSGRGCEGRIVEKLMGALKGEK